MGDENNQLLKRANGLTRTARLRLFWERYAPVFALAALFTGLFAIGSFSGIWERIGDPWRLISLIVALYFLIRATLRARQVKMPSRSDARRRVEFDSGVKHRPLDVLEDKPVTGHDLWPEHYQSARAKAETLKPAKGRPALAPLDKYYVRYILPCAVGLAMLAGAGDNFERLKRSLSPSWQAGISQNNVTFDAWVDPPDYTGRPPIYFKDKTTVRVPAGSELVARMSGTRDATRLKITGKHRSRYLPLERLGPKSFEARTIIDEKSTARWRVGTLEKRWVISAAPDRIPQVSIDLAPEADKRDRLAFAYSLEDDYGVVDLVLQMRLLSDDPDAPDIIENVPVPISGGAVRKTSMAKAALDLTKHKWAGRKVVGRLIAKDGIGQTNQTPEYFFTVPDKIFVEPLSKAVMEQRSLVLAGQAAYGPLPRLTRKEWTNRPTFDTDQPQWHLDRAPESLQRAAELIDAITDSPEGLYRDPAVYMGLKNVLYRLKYAEGQEELAGIPEDLWSIAIRAEFGVLGTALEEMREAEAALRDGMARRAPQREIDALFERYNEAVDRYMEELMDQATVSDEPGGSGGDAQNTDEIQKLLDAIEEANRQGDTEGARRALAQLAELLENMQIQLTQGEGGSGDGPPQEGEMSEEMKEALEDLADLLGEQRELKDQTEQSQNESGSEGSDGQPSPGEEQQPGEDNDRSGSGGADILTPQELAEQQRALQESLDGLVEAIPEEGLAGGGQDEDGENGGGGEEGQDPAQDLADAETAMDGARRALENGDLPGAAQGQQDAIDALRRAGRGLAEQVMDGRGDGEEANSAETDDTDPLGRSNNGRPNEDSEADLEQKDNATRSRELLEELRRRASEQEREELEREYLERLLKRF